MTIDHSRRRFLRSGVAWPIAGSLSVARFGSATAAFATAPANDPYRKLLVLVELKGGNDGLNTVVPYTDPAYYALRPKLAIARDAVVQLSDRVGLHPALASLSTFWRERELAVLQGVGYPAPNLSHFRSIEIWDTASPSDVFLQDGWLTRTFTRNPVDATYAADGVVIGSNDLGPLSGNGARTIALGDTQTFLRRARLAQPAAAASNLALAHILKVEADIVQARGHLVADRAFETEFPSTAFGNAIKWACQVIANPSGVAAVRLTLAGFDTHTNQTVTQARLLDQLATGLTALRSALGELGRWSDTLVLTYAEFGRRPKENLSQGTDHGTANVHFALGGRVVGGLYGEAPNLAALPVDGNPRHALDFRAVYATVLERWWHIDSRSALGERFTPVPFVRT
ncbi:MAG TPA: DUF1501 domain-containing protein [Casimicrobiaceae bacterium]